VLQRLDIPALIVVGTDAGVGKTVVGATIARWFRNRGTRIAVFKPIDTKCVRRREGLVSEDAEFLAAAADAPHPLDLICPQRYAQPQLPPALAAERSGQPIDPETIARALKLVSRDSEVMIVECPARVGDPLAPPSQLTLDLVRDLAAPAIVVARPQLASLSSIVLTVRTLKSANVPIAGIVVNRYPAESASVTEELHLRAIERWSGAPLLAVVPEEPVRGPALPPGITAAIDAVDWGSRL
jgi:dethiobiotin synthetase